MRHVIVGPPGTGKTNRLVEIANKNAKLGFDVGYFAFSKRAAAVANKRIDFELKDCRTLHSLAFKQGGFKKEQVMTLEGLAEFASLDCSPKNFDPDENEFWRGHTDDDETIFQIGRAKSNGRDKTKYDGRIREVWEIMDRYKKLYGLVDYHDMLDRCEIFPSYDVLILDEGQDLTYTHRKFFNTLRARNPNADVYIALDPDQNIFSWAGSKAVIDWNDVEVLKKSYRVPAPMYKLAMQVIGHCKNRRQFNWQPADHDGNIEYCLKEEVPDQNLKDLLILVRNKCYIPIYTYWLKERGLEYGYLHGGGTGRSIKIGTIHEAKGAEADNVILDLNMTMKSWFELYSDEENRVWYTAITRTKKNLFLMMPQQRRNASDFINYHG